MKIKKDYYNTWLFDCDGVLLDSNSLKSDAFYDTVLPYGEKHANDFVAYHRENGGISRYEKFNYFFKNILMNGGEEELENAIQQYGENVYKQMLVCPFTKGMLEIVSSIPDDARVYVVSGGKQAELRKIFAQRKINTFFDDIFGSPDSKDEILNRLKVNGDITLPALFVGDSKYDCEVAKKHGLDVLFISEYSEFSEWKSYCEENSIPTRPSLLEIHFH